MLSDLRVNGRKSSSRTVDDHAKGKEIKTVRVLFLALSFVMAGAADALAYIDPNTGGYVFQLLFPIISIIAFAYLFLKRQVKLLFARIISFFKHILEKVYSVLGISRGDINKGSD